MLSARGLSFSYRGAQVVRRVSLALKPGELVGLIGPNGAGKSTLIRLLTRVLKPDGGEILLDSAPLDCLPRLELARRIAVVPQVAQLPEGYRAHEIVMMGRTPHLGLLGREGPADAAAVEAAMRRTDTWRYRERLASELSGGEQQRLILARALAQVPEYLLLDEPNSHLDIGYQLELLKLAKDQAAAGVGVLAILHDLNLAARLCDRLMLMQRGSVIAEGSPEAVLQSEVLSAAYGAPLSVAQLPGQPPLVLPAWPTSESSSQTPR
jgi:iron complex transport system ATP-binding protein